MVKIWEKQEKPKLG